MDKITRQDLLLWIGRLGVSERRLLEMACEDDKIPG